jgi:hypothetical protein
MKKIEPIKKIKPTTMDIFMSVLMINIFNKLTTKPLAMATSPADSYHPKNCW